MTTPYWPPAQGLGVREIMKLVELYEKLRRKVGHSAFFALYDLLLALDNLGDFVHGLHRADPNYKYLAASSTAMLRELRDFCEDFERKPRKQQPKGITP